MEVYLLKGNSFIKVKHISISRISLNFFLQRMGCWRILIFLPSNVEEVLEMTLGLSERKPMKLKPLLVESYSAASMQGSGKTKSSVLWFSPFIYAFKLLKYISNKN
jgi:hypothetical protein